LFLFSHNYGSAQFDSLTIDPLLPLDTFDVCDGVHAKASFTVRYDQFAQVYFRTEIPEYEMSFFISSSNNPNLSFAVDTLSFLESEDPELLLTVNQAGLNEVFQLWAQNDCGDTLLLADVSSSKSNSSSVPVSNKLFYTLGDIDGYLNFYDLLENDSSVLFEEKLSFVQKYFFDDSAFSSGSISTGGILDTLPVNHDRLLPCYCKLIKGKPLKEPFTNGDPEFYGSSFVRYNFPYVLKNNEETVFSKWGTIHSMAHIGPARYINNYSTGVCTGSKYSILGTGDELTSPTITSLLFNWSFSSGPYGEWCDDSDDLCEKQVNYSVKYDTRLQAVTQLRWASWFCGTNKASRARAEEYAALILKDDNGRFEVLEVNRAGVASEESTTYSDEWFLTVLEFAGTIVRVAAGDSTGVLDLIESTAELIENIITNDYVEKDGAENKDLPFTLLNNNTGTFQIKPNSLTELMLVSSGLTATGGALAWKSNSRIESNYRLAAGINGGVADAPSEYCCSDGFSTWSLASMREAPVNYLALFNSVDAFLFTLGHQYDGNDLGSAVSYFNCPTPTDESAARGIFDSTNELNGRTIDYYQLFDVNGRLVDESNYYININENAIMINKPEYSGMFFIVAHVTDGSFITSKFFVSKNQPTNEVYVNFK